MVDRPVVNTCCRQFHAAYPVRRRLTAPSLFREPAMTLLCSGLTLIFGVPVQLGWLRQACHQASRWSGTCCGFANSLSGSKGRFRKSSRFPCFSWPTVALSQAASRRLACVSELPSGYRLPQPLPAWFPPPWSWSANAVRSSRAPVLEGSQFRVPATHLPHTPLAVACSARMREVAQQNRTGR